MKYLFFIVFLASSIYAQSASEDHFSDHFSFGRVELSLGQRMPQKNLYDVLEKSPAFQLGMQFGYYESAHFPVHFRMEASYAEMKHPRVDFHNAIGRIGFDWDFFQRYHSELGTGLTMHFLRASEAREEGLLLEDNESDYGWYFRLQPMAMDWGRFRLGLEAHYDIVWSSPRASHFVQVAVKTGWRLW